MAERIRGVNLSGWFIPEPWVTPSLFAATGASNEVELQQALGSAVYNERLRQHYETFITEFDFSRMSAIGFNSVRLPVPWYVFGSQGDSLAYIPVVDYVDRAIEWAEKYHMTVLLDLATVPGGQGDSNESATTPESAADWHSSTNGRAVALDVLDRLAERYGSHPALAMWHISNEFGGECHCPLCYAAFREWLQAKYKTLDALNEAWWTGFWSHRFQSWDQLVPFFPVLMVHSSYKIID